MCLTRLPLRRIETEEDEGIVQRNQALASGGRQQQRRRPSQLILDGLKSEEHLLRALTTPHPYSYELRSTLAVELAHSGLYRGARLVEHRYRIMKHVEELSVLTADENDASLAALNPTEVQCSEHMKRRTRCY